MGYAGPMVPSPVDYQLVRVALVAAVRQATGLGQNQVVMMEPEVPVGVRPDVPFAAIKLTTLAVKMGWDVAEHAGLSGAGEGQFVYHGPRTLMAAFDFYGEDHEQAYGLAAAFQSGLDQDDVWGALAQNGLSVLRVDQVVDLSSLLSTGFEGRAHLTVTFGLTAKSTVDVGYIAHAPVVGVAQDASGTTLNVSLTADLQED